MSNARILIIDDDETFPELFKDELNKNYDLNFNLDWYDSFNEDIKNKMSYDYDLYILDHRFGGMGKSREILEYIKENHKDSCVFLVSVHGSFKLAKELIERGIDGMVDKNDLEFDFMVQTVKDRMETKEHLLSLQAKIKNQLVSI